MTLIKPHPVHNRFCIEHAMEPNMSDMAEYDVLGLIFVAGYRPFLTEMCKFLVSGEET